MIEAIGAIAAALIAAAIGAAGWLYRQNLNLKRTLSAEREEKARKQIETVETKLDELGRKLQTIEGKLDDNARSQGKHAGDIQTLSSRLSQTDSVVKSHTEQLNRVWEIINKNIDLKGKQ